MQIKKSKKTDVTANSSKSRRHRVAEALRHALVDNGYSLAEVDGMGITDLQAACRENNIDYAPYINTSDTPCNSCNSSTSTDKALKHIKAAIDILATEDSEVAKDSIANLATVMFDIKGSTKIDK